jgi:hypothetical protein
MSDNLKFHLDSETYHNMTANPMSSMYKKNQIDNNYLIPTGKESYEDSLKELESGSLSSRYSSYMSDLKIIRKDLSEAHVKFSKARLAEEYAEKSRAEYHRILQREADGLTLSPAELSLLDQTNPELMEKFLSEFKVAREKCQQEKSRLADLMESLEGKATTIRTKYGASVIFEDEHGRFRRKFTSAAAGVLQPNKRSQQEVALTLINRFTTEKLLKLDFEKGVSLIKEYRDSWEVTHDMHALFSLIANNMEASKNTMDRLSMSKMVYEGLNRERQADFNRTIATLMSVAENAKEMKKSALRSKREKDEANKKAKDTKTPGKQKSIRGGSLGRGRGRGRGGSRGRGGQKRKFYEKYDSRDNRDYYEPTEQKTPKPEFHVEKPVNTGGENFRARGRGGHRGSRGGSRY